MTITAFALFVSALALHDQGQLSLYHAILVSILLYLHGFVALSISLGGIALKGPYVRTPQERSQFHRSMSKARLAGIPVIFIAVVFSLFVWHHVHSLGPYAVTCNPHTVVIILGSRLVATQTGRTAGLAISYIFLFYLISIAYIDARNLLRHLIIPHYNDRGFLLSELDEELLIRE